MDSDKIIEQYLAEQNNDVAQTTQSNLKVENVKPLERVSSDFIMLGGFIGFVICWAAIFLMLSKRVRLARKEIAINIKTLEQIPCKNCNFYSNDPHLKCAVNPSAVMTEKAVDCTDYCTRKNKSF
jgi:hypothetical protein